MTMRFEKLSLIFCLFVSGYVWAASEPPLAVVALSDIHFDPFMICKEKKLIPCPLIMKLRDAPSARWASILQADDTSRPSNYHDADYTLLRAALGSAHHSVKENHAQFVIIVGDYLGHEYRQHYKRYTGDRSRANYQAFVKKTFEFLFSELHQAFPETDVYTVIGNNDSYTADYGVVPQGAFFQDLSVLSASVVPNTAHRAELQKTFSLAGYYAVQLNEHLRLIVLNSVLFSRKARGPSLPNAATRELDWLHQQLATAKKQQQRVLIAMHIPEGKDIYLLSSIKLFRIFDFWGASYTKRFNAEVAQFAPEIAGIMTGHLHWEYSHTLSMGNAEVDMIGVPAISRIFGTDSSYDVLTYAVPGYELDDIDTIDVI